jgi:hypothetical protein
MEIKYMIFAIDDNPEYSDFWPINSEICRKKLGITPVLFHITNEDSDFYEDDFGLVKKVKALTNINTGFQAQIFRMYGTKFFPNDICMTNDIDMLLFNRDYLEYNLKDLDDDSLVIFASDGYDSSRPECSPIEYSVERYPICYITGKGSIFNQLLNTDVSFLEYCLRLLSLELGWDTDEIYFGSQVGKNEIINVHKIKRGISSNFYTPGRIEKHNFIDLNVSKLDLNGVIDIEYFIDCHCARPYSIYEKEINNLKNLILKTI